MYIDGKIPESSPTTTKDGDVKNYEDIYDDYYFFLGRSKSEAGFRGKIWEVMII